MEEWIKFIPPALLLVVWALNSVFNREEQPAAPAGRQPPGPRPGGLPPAPRPIERPGPAAPTMRWPSPAEAVPPRRPPTAADDEILIIRAEPNRPQATASGSSPRAVRRLPRAKPVPAGRPETAKPAPLTTGVVQSVAQDLGRTMELKPLTTSLAPSTPTPTTPTRAATLRDAFQSRSQLGEAFVLSELLQPPLAMRRQRRF